MFSGKHVITTDDKGFRSNKKINYEKKPSNVFRIVTIGGSTTEQPATDDNKTWSNLLVDDLSRYTNRDIELINVGMSGLRAKHHYLSLKRVKKI